MADKQKQSRDSGIPPFRSLSALCIVLSLLTSWFERSTMLRRIGRAKFMCGDCVAIFGCGKFNISFGKRINSNRICLHRANEQKTSKPKEASYETHSLHTFTVRPEL